MGGADTGDRGVTGRPRDPGGREGGFGASLFCPWGSDRPAEVGQLPTYGLGRRRARTRKRPPQAVPNWLLRTCRGRAAAGHPTRMSPRLGLRGGGRCDRRMQTGRGRCVARGFPSAPAAALVWSRKARAKPAPPLSSPSPVAYPSDAVPRPSLPPLPRALSSDGRERQHAGALTQAAVSSEDLKSAARAHWRPGPGTGVPRFCPPAAPAPRPAPPRSSLSGGGGGALSFTRAPSPPSVSFRRRRRCCWQGRGAIGASSPEGPARGGGRLPRVPGRAAPGPAPFDGLRRRPVERRRGRRAA